MKKLRRSVMALTLMAAVVASDGQGAHAAGAQSCSSGDVCFAHQASGSVYYGFVSSALGNLSNFTYDGPGTQYDVSVNNNVGFGRNRDSAWARACFYGGFNQYSGTLLFNAPYSGATWVVDPTTTWGTSSYASTNSAFCPN